MHGVYFGEGAAAFVYGVGEGGAARVQVLQRALLCVARERRDRVFTGLRAHRIYVQMLHQNFKHFSLRF